MIDYRKLVIHNYWKILLASSVGLVDAIFMFSLPIITSDRDIVTTIMFCLLGISGLVLWIYGILQYIYCTVVFTNKRIFVEEWGKQIKSVDLKDIKRIIVYTITRGGKVREAIIIDDGTFLIYKDIYYPLTKNSKYQESWIVIQYTRNRLQKIKETLPNCPVEEINGSEWIK